MNSAMQKYTSCRCLYLVCCELFCWLLVSCHASDTIRQGWDVEPQSWVRIHSECSAHSWTARQAAAAPAGSRYRGSDGTTAQGLSLPHSHVCRRLCKPSCLTLQVQLFSLYPSTSRRFLICMLNYQLLVRWLEVLWHFHWQLKFITLSQLSFSSSSSTSIPHCSVLFCPGWGINCCISPECDLVFLKVKIQYRL